MMSDSGAGFDDQSGCNEQGVSVPLGKKRGPKDETQMKRPLPNDYRKERLSRGETMQQVADVIGVTAQAIWKLEVRDEFSHEKRMKLCRYYKKSPNDLEKN
jgi:DNA-binding XRE family transcriptional regulator